MSRPVDDSFTTLLRWYPRWWREVNGEVLLGALREHAESENRSRPTRADVWSATVNGIGTRLDARVAVWAAVSAVAAGAGAWLLLIFLPGGMWALLFTAIIAPLLTLIAAIAFLQSRGWIVAGRALAVLAVLASAIILAAAAQLSWAQGFRLADAGLPQTGLAAAWAPLVAAALLAGVVGFTVLFDAWLHRTRLSRWSRVFISLVCASLVTPIIGVSLIQPMTVTIVAILVAVGALQRYRVEAPLSSPREALTLIPAARGSVRARRSAIRWLGCSSAAFGAFGIAYALTGASWSPAAVDGTAAMAQGIILLLASGIPLLAAVGLASTRGRRRAAVWIPLSLAALSLTSCALAYLGAPDWQQMSVGMTASAVLGGAAIACWLTPRLRGPLAARAGIGIASGVGYAALIGISVLPMLVFSVPILGILISILGSRDRKAPAGYWVATAAP